MHRVVLDTNILVSGIGWPGIPRQILEKLIDGKLILVESPALLNEFIEVIKDEKFGFLEEDNIDEFYMLLVEKSEVVEPAFELNVIKEDATDNRVLECAVAGHADHIVTGDRHLLRIGSFAGIKIVTAKQMSELLNIALLDNQ